MGVQKPQKQQTHVREESTSRTTAAEIQWVLEACRLVLLHKEMPNPSTTVSNQRTEGQTTLICTGKQGVEEEEQTCQRSRIAFMQAVPSASENTRFKFRGYCCRLSGPKWRSLFCFNDQFLSLLQVLFFNKTLIWNDLDKLSSFTLWRRNTLSPWGCHNLQYPDGWLSEIHIPSYPHYPLVIDLASENPCFNDVLRVKTSNFENFQFSSLITRDCKPQKSNDISTIPH